MPCYSKHGRQETPITMEEFLEKMKGACFTGKKHKAFLALLYYSGVRVSELLRAKKEAFKLNERSILFDVGQRLKGGLVTPPLYIGLDLPYADEIAHAIRYTRKGERVFPYSRMTGYNIVSRVFTYPHHLRLSRITNILQKGFSIPEVKSWSGHRSASSLDSYIGIVNIQRIGESLNEKKP